MSKKFKNILIIGFERFNKTIISALFSNPEYQIYDSNDGVEAIKIAEQHPPSLVIIETNLMEYIDGNGPKTSQQSINLSNNQTFDVLDVGFPKENFIKTVIVLMQRYINLPIIGVSVCDSPFVNENVCFTRLINISGSVETISKPIDRKQLIKVFDSWLNDAIFLKNNSNEESATSRKNYSQKRVVNEPIPNNLNQLLTNEQRKAINTLEDEGWEILFVRRQMFQNIEVIVINNNGNDTARLLQDGSLQKDHNIVMRT